MGLLKCCAVIHADVATEGGQGSRSKVSKTSQKTIVPTLVRPIQTVIVVTPCDHNHIDQHMIISHPTIMHSVLLCTVYRLRKLCNSFILEPYCLIAGMGYRGV